MGILIELSDQDYQYCQDYANGKTNIFALNNTSRVIKAVANGMPYEAKLKADMIAMLEEIQLEIEEYKRDLSNKDITKVHEDFDHNNLIEVISGNIQQKINELKEQIDQLPTTD